MYLKFKDKNLKIFQIHEHGKKCFVIDMRNTTWLLCWGKTKKQEARVCCFFNFIKVVCLKDIFEIDQFQTFQTFQTYLLNS